MPCLRELLLLSGDVETNPGPELAVILKQLQNIIEDLKEIKEERLTSIESKLELLTTLDSKLSSCVTQVSNLQRTVADLEMKVDDLENRSRRSNLIVYGVDENPNGSEDSLDQVINSKIITGMLKMNPVSIERAHRLGKPNSEKKRPIICKLLDYRDKESVLKNCRRLKGSNISIGEDFSVRVRDIRRKLWNSAKANKESGDKVFLVYDKLKINKVLYRWDDATNDKVPLLTGPNESSAPKNPQGEGPYLRSRRHQQQAK